MGASVPKTFNFTLPNDTDFHKLPLPENAIIRRLVVKSRGLSGVDTPNDFEYTHKRDPSDVTQPATDNPAVKLSAGDVYEQYNVELRYFEMYVKGTTNDVIEGDWVI